jgi:tetratricopeptide (TPR) repeat protein
VKKAAIILFCLAIFLPAAMAGNDAKFYFDSGCKKGIAKDFDGAIADFTKAIKLDPKNKDAYDLRGSMNAYKGDFTAANADWTKAVEIDPKFARAYMNRAMGRKAIGDIDGAIEDLTEANKLGINEALVIRSELLTNGYSDPRKAKTGGFIFYNNKGYYVLPKGGLEIQGIVVGVIDGFNIVVRDIVNNDYHICLDKMVYPPAKSAEFKKAKIFTDKYCLGRHVIVRAPPQEKKDCLKGTVAVNDVKIFLNDALIAAKLAKKLK